MKILAIETSCDETAISVLEIKGGPKNPRFKVLSNVISSQVKLHAKWGGVVPSLAKREHQKNLVPVLIKSLKESKLLKSKIKSKKSKLQIKIQNELNKILERELELLRRVKIFLRNYEAPKIDLIVVTNGPGLEPALWVGINFAKALAIAWNKPLFAANHMEGHLFSVFLQEKQRREFPISNFQFPIITLLVSGGHTELILIKNWLKYKMLGQTRDDAAGEAFDKVAKMLNLGYPGGPAINRIAEAAGGHRMSFKLPRPMLNSKDYDFSFSGLKTAVLYKLKEIRNLTPEIKAIFCKEFQQAVTDVLISKTMRAVKEFKAKTVILGGGVAANKELRKQFQKKIAITNDRKYLLNLLMPEIKFTGDNAAMIALAAYFRFIKKKGPADWQALKADGNLKIF